MRSTKMRILSVCLVMVLCISVVFSVAGCGSTSAKNPETTEPAKETAKEEPKDTVAAGDAKLTLAHDKLNPNFQPFFEQWAIDAKEKTGVTLTPVSYPSTDVFSANMKTALPTNKTPDLFTWWSTYWGEELVAQDLAMDISDVWDKHKDEYPEGLRKAFTFNGKTYGFPLNMNYWIGYYNKEVFEANGFSVPKTWDEFIKLCDGMKAKGITPLNQTVNGEWPAFIWFEELFIRSNPDAYEQLSEGKIKWTDPAVKEVFTMWADMINKGYFTDPSADFFADMPKMFNEGKLGVIVSGSWYQGAVLEGNGVASDKIGTFLLPSIKDNVGNVVIYEVGAMQVAKNSQNPEAAKKMVDYMMSVEGSGFIAKQGNLIPGNPKADTSFLKPQITEIINSINTGSYRMVNRFWEAFPTSLMQKANSKFAEFILDPGTVDKVLADIQAAADEYYAKAR